MRNNHSRIHKLGNTSQLVYTKSCSEIFLKPESLDGILYWHSVGVFAILWHILYLPKEFIAKANIERGVGTREI
jgi:hypothetical protein